MCLLQSASVLRSSTLGSAVAAGLLIASVTIGARHDAPPNVSGPGSSGLVVVLDGGEWGSDSGGMAVAWVGVECGPDSCGLVSVGVGLVIALGECEGYGFLVALRRSRASSTILETVAWGRTWVPIRMARSELVAWRRSASVRMIAR